MIKGLVSVIVPTFDRVIKLNRCIKGIANQSYKDVEIIIVSDGYSKNIENFVIKSPLNNISYFHTKKWNGFPSESRNMGINLSKGEYIAFCDDDDQWVEEKIEIQLKFLKKNQLRFTSSNAFLRRGYEQHGEELFHKKEEIKLTNLSLIYSNKIITSSVLFRRDLFGGDYQELFPVNLNVGEDWIAWISLKLGCKDEFGYLDKGLVIYDVSSDSLSSKLDIKILINQFFIVNRTLLEENHLLLSLCSFVFFILRLIRHFLNFLTGLKFYI